MEVHDLLTGGKLGRFKRGHYGPVTAVAFSPNGRALATGGTDGTILLWDWERACGLGPSAGTPEQAWKELASADARRAWQAMMRLSSPDALPLLSRRLAPVTAADCRPLRRAIARLDSEDFETRQQASAQLEKTWADHLFIIDESLAARPSLEVVLRLRKALDRPQMQTWSPSTLRLLRAVAALERMGTPGAKALLKRVAAGEPRAKLTREARAALARK